MNMLPLRLTPGDDLRRALEAAVTAQGCTAAFVLSGIGSLAETRVRLAGTSETQTISGNLEIISLVGTIAANGSHLHGALATADGKVLGGHIAYGCIIRTTAEVLLALLPEWDFTREPDETTGYDELVVRRKTANGND
jgi:predicted DNA-binding protein with PD1-like motif